MFGVVNVAEMDKELDCKSNPERVMGSSPIVHKSPVSLMVKCPPFKRCVIGSIPILGNGRVVMVTYEIHALEISVRVLSPSVSSGVVSIGKILDFKSKVVSSSLTTRVVFFLFRLFS